MISPTPALLHGFFGFAHCGPVAYFRGIAQALRRAGIVPLIPEVPAVGSIAEVLELDINPLKVQTRGALAVDVRVRVGHLRPGAASRRVVY